MGELKIKRLSEKGVIPTKAHSTDAGYDLYSTENYTLAPLERKLFKTEIAMAIPSGYYGRIADRSGNAYKKGIHCMAGVIDETYRGDVGVLLVNLSNVPVSLEKGDRIAQIIIENYQSFPVVEVDNLDITVRNEGGFGSTGN